MIPTHVVPYRHGDLRIGWASWDNGRYQDRSIKWAYADSSGKISRGAPELPFDILIDMVELAAQQGELEPYLKSGGAAPKAVVAASTAELEEERRSLGVRLTLLQKLMADLPWANWRPLYNQVGARLYEVKMELARRPG